MAVPAAVVGGIGGLLYWQNTTGDWESWAYAWTLIPGFAGVGTLLAGLLGETPRISFRHGMTLILVSLVMFGVFAAIFGKAGVFGPYWPVLIILLGVWLLVRAVMHSRSGSRW
jgi:peptidoglycan/LPS O-acetylase OafA/YrhL